MLDAQVALAEMLVNGRGGPRDLAAALKLFEKAATQALKATAARCSRSERCMVAAMAWR